MAKQILIRTCIACFEAGFILKLVITPLKYKPVLFRNPPKILWKMYKLSV